MDPITDDVSRGTRSESSSPLSGRRTSALEETLREEIW